ncbi:NPCBM/NEW2 domain-containing protein [bacterium]|nr:NPCBM/NEW2 domain-containing protein [bacterium]
MKPFLISVVVALLLVAGGFWYASRNPDALPEDLRNRMEVGQDTSPPARGPLDYHILADQGGVPRSEAERAGLSSGNWAYMAALKPLEDLEQTGIEQLQSARVNGKLYDLGFRFNSTQAESQVLEYNIGGEWDTLTFGFGFSDDEASDPSGRFAIEFSVQGDGTELYGPVSLTPNDMPVFREVDVKGVRRVTFISKRVGKPNMFTPLLLDPFVKKEGTSASE